ncbi:MAG: glutaredoxin family protein [Chromatiales bacterium]|jgi:hypothetical protein|nr:glutaredoxin family protein [Chromatiales bacterium]
MTNPTLQLIVRDGCHLCDDMRDALEAFRDELGFGWDEFDVDADPVLKAKFDLLVPVLLRDEYEICHYFLDSVALRDALLSTGG